MLLRIGFPDDKDSYNGSSRLRSPWGALWALPLLFLSCSTPTSSSGTEQAAILTLSPSASATPRPSLAPASLTFKGTHLFDQTYERMPQLKAGLHCSSCHLQGGTALTAAPLMGIANDYPKYSDRAGGQITLADRVNECFERNLNGPVLPVQSEEMLALVAYLESLKAVSPQPRGVAMLAKPPAEPDSERGKSLYSRNCRDCHGADGGGTYKAGAYTYPALWGDRSFTKGAEMAQPGYLASFISVKMPLGRGKTLTDQAAWDIATYITQQPRPEFPPK